MSTLLHQSAPHHLPAFITAPGETDTLMVAVGAVLVVGVLIVGTLVLRLHTLPERLAHKGQKLQFEIVAVLGLLALFTHIHLFWVAGLLLALIDIPDFSGAFSRMAAALERIAGIRTEPAPEAPDTAARENRSALLAGGTTPGHGAKSGELAHRGGGNREATHA